jgi:hypothetical protein
MSASKRSQLHELVGNVPGLSSVGPLVSPKEAEWHCTRYSVSSVMGRKAFHRCMIRYGIVAYRGYMVRRLMFYEGRSPILPARPLARATA